MLSSVFLTSILVVTSPSTLSLNVQGSIEATLVKAVPRDGAALGAQVARLLGWEGDVARHIYRDDKLILAYEPGPELVALSYRGLKIKLTAYRHIGPDGIGRFYHDDGTLVEPALKRAPLTQYIQITEVPQRGRGKRKHDGVDFKADVGTPITLPFNATIQRVNWNRRINGNCVEATYPDGKRARFLHLHTVATNVKPGRRLTAGSELGTVGSTGRSGGPHLHYELLDKRGRVVDPLKHHGTYHPSIDPTQMASFRTTVVNVRSLLRLR